MEIVTSQNAVLLIATLLSGQMTIFELPENSPCTISGFDKIKALLRYDLISCLGASLPILTGCDG